MIKKRIILLGSLMSVLFTFSACKEDLLSEITTLDVDRAFSPTALVARVENQTNVRLSWNNVFNAESYTIEIFENLDFSGSAVRTVEGVSFTQLPFVVTGLAGETNYAVRVKAVGAGINDSKWITATFKTDPEQIFRPVDLATVTAAGVTLTWTPGQIATSIVFTPGNITRPVTAAEITAGRAVITGLVSETAYTAKLMNGTKTRGTATFTTLLDLGGATAVSPTDDLAAAIAAAQPGAVLALLPGTYNINTDIIINKSISIRGAKPSDRPIINGLIFRVRANAALNIKDLVLNGTGSLNGNQTIIYDEASDNAYGNLVVEDCIIRNYVKGIIYVNLKTLIESVTYRGNIIHSIECNGGDFVDFRNGLAKTFTFINNTVYNSALARDFFRMDGGGSTNFPGQASILNISNNTFNAIANGATRRVLYIRLTNHQINFTKNILANTEGYYSNQAITTITTMANNNYFNAPNFTASTTAGAKNDTGTFTSLNPGFTDAANGNFTLGNADLKFNRIGDPRWF